MAFEKVKEVAGKYSSGLEKGRQGVEQVGSLVKGVSQLKGSLSGNGSGGGGSRAGGAIEGVKKVARAAKGQEPKVVKTSHLIEEHIEVGVPRREAYNQWTQFKQFSQLMKGVENVEQKGPDKVSWTAKIGPSRRQWKTQITEQIPDERIAWKTTGGAETVGVVTFHSLDDRLTPVMLQMEYHPKGFIEWFGNLFRMPRRRVHRDLKLYKNYLELAGKASGGWRGTIRKKEDLKKGGKNEEAAEGTGEGSKNGGGSSRTSQRPSSRSKSSSRSRPSSSSSSSSARRRSTGRSQQRRSA